MDGRQVDTGIRYAGQQQIQTLAFSTLHALEKAGLHDSVDELKRRVLDRRWEEICDVEADGDALQVSYKPMVELLLYEIKHIARVLHATSEDRRNRIEWAMTVAGM